MEKVFEKVEIGIEIVSVFTLRGRKEIIKLSDFVYGEWLVFKENELVYYINVFDPYFSQLKTDLEEKKFTIEEFLDSVNNKNAETFSLDQNILGVKSSLIEYATIEVYKFPFS